MTADTADPSGGRVEIAWSKDTIINHIVHCGSRPPGKERHSYPVGYSKGLKITCQELTATARSSYELT